MRVFNINKAIGGASSGVEYAQKYRRQIFAEIEWVEDYYVFTDYISTNLSVFSDALGFDRTQILWIYNLLTGRRAAPCTVDLEEFVAELGQPVDAPQLRGEEITDIALTNSSVRYRIRTHPGHLVDRVETLLGDQLLRVEHYDESLNNVEHFHDGKLARRVFYTSDGRIALEQFYRSGDITRSLITSASPLYHRALRKGQPSSFHGDIVLEGRSQFFQFVLEQLFSLPDDVVIVDRALDVIDAIYPVIGDHRLYSVVHAEHYDLKQRDDDVLLWNNHYENVFTHPDMIDGLIVSTQRQKEVLERQLATVRRDIGEVNGPEVVCIPVGFLTVPAAPHRRYDPNALVTASRLADEKHIDLLIRAVIEARKVLPDLCLDVYGEGRRDKLLDLIQKTDAQAGVRLMGHQSLDRILGSYALYVTASTSEGFGLSLLEAMAEGVPIVGFDVEYGNRELVEQGINGRLVPYSHSDRDVIAIADAIVKVLTSEHLDAMRTESLHRAEAYTADSVRKAWEALLREAPGCRVAGRPVDSSGGGSTGDAMIGITSSVESAGGFADEAVSRSFGESARERDDEADGEVS